MIIKLKTAVLLSMSMRTHLKTVRYLSSLVQTLPKSENECSTLQRKCVHQARCYHKNITSAITRSRSDSLLLGGLEETSSTFRLFHSSNHLQSQEISKVHIDKGKKCVDVYIGHLHLNIPFLWLRDHCRSDVYYNWDTNQKNVDTDLLQKDLTPLDVTLTSDNNCINIKCK